MFLGFRSRDLNNKVCFIDEQCTVMSVSWHPFEGFSYNFIHILILIYLLTAIGLSPGGSSTVHIYSKTIHRTTQDKQDVEQHNNLGECGPCRVLASYTWHLPYNCSHLGLLQKRFKSEHNSCAYLIHFEEILNLKYLFFLCCATAQLRPRSPHCWGF
jgi:hypothetical protein